jgi:geranylgeranyl diphosphate synthase type I
MDWLTSLYPQIKKFLLDQLPEHWPDLDKLANAWIGTDIIPEIIPLVAACKAVGGDPLDTVSIGAAILAAEISVRILDDVQDRDKPNALYQQVGLARALNYADAFKTLAFKIIGEVSLSKQALGVRLYQAFVECYFIALAGQDRDLRGAGGSWEEYWQMIEMKTAYIYSTTAALGAMLGTKKVKLIEACKTYGYHLGIAIQIFNDLEGIWEAKGDSDLTCGRVTLPLLYGIHCDRPEREELITLIGDHQISLNASKIKEILAIIDAKGYLVWLALKQREQALKAIQICPDEEGRLALESRFTAMFGNIEELIEKNTKSSYSDTLDQGSTALPPKTLDVYNSHSEQPFSSYRSIGLSLRRNLRN